MGMRKYYRAIARNRMQACSMKFKDVGINSIPSRIRKLMKTRNGRKKLRNECEAVLPLWRRFLWGKEANRAFFAQMNYGRRMQLSRSMAQARMRKA